jgi:hypothetical protein
MLLPSQDASAVPAFARKYGTSCYTCHSGFPNRNAFGEAFKNNGYRWPGGEDEEKAKQEQVKVGSDGWKKSFPQSPWPADIPGYAPVAIWITGPLMNYTEGVKTPTRVITPQTLNWNGPIDARILFGGTIGDNIGIVGGIEGIGAGSTTTNLRATWAFSPGVNLSVGNGFSAFVGNATPISNYTTVFPASGTGVEVNYAVGNSGGFQVIGGLASAGKGTNAGISDTEGGTTVILGTVNANSNSNKLYDTSYLRLRYKIGGAGLRSGAGGHYGNEFVGLDDCLNIGASVVGARSGILASNYKAEHLVYGADLSGNYGNFTAGFAYSRDRDLKLNNYSVDAGYYIYPWMLARVKYSSLGVADKAGNPNSQTNPTITPSLTAWLRANVSLAASWKIFTKGTDPTQLDGRNNADTATLTASLAF